MDEYEDLDTYDGDTEHDMWLTSTITKTPAAPMFSMKTTSINILTT